MTPTYADCAALFKALGDETRLKIFGMLSQREVCACDLLAELDITQPTLSHHMKVLTGCGLVNARKDGSWMRYTASAGQLDRMQSFLEARKATAPAGQSEARGKNVC